MIITEPGIYDIPEDEYHADPVPGGSLSSTGAKTIYPEGGPARFDYQRRHGGKKSKAMDLGTVVHGLVLGTGQPARVLDYPNWTTNKAKDAKKQAIADGCIPMLPDGYAEAQAIARAVLDHDIAGGLFAPGEFDAEVSMFWYLDEFGIWCRGRLDAMAHIAGRVVIGDLKTAADASEEGFAKAVDRYCYHVQEVHYRTGLAVLLGCDWEDIDFIFAVAETEPPTSSPSTTPSSGASSAPDAAASPTSGTATAPSPASGPATTPTSRTLRSRATRRPGSGVRSMTGTTTMTADLAVRNSAPSSYHARRARHRHRDRPHGTSSRQLAALSQLGVKDAGDGDRLVFLHQAQRTGLDPFSRQIYMIGRNEYDNDTKQWRKKWTIQTGIDGFRVNRARAERTAGVRGILGRAVFYDPDGNEHPVWVRREPPVACEITYTVRDGNGETPYTSVLRFNEYVQLNKDGEPIAQWKTKPAHMLEKCTEADVYRKAFPQDFSGVDLDDAMPAPDPDAPPVAPERQRVTAEQLRQHRPPRVTATIVAGTPDPSSPAHAAPPRHLRRPPPRRAPGRRPPAATRPHQQRPAITTPQTL